MSHRLPLVLRRTLAAALCAQMLLHACAVQALSPMPVPATPAEASVWPRVSEPVGPQPQIAVTAALPSQHLPNFDAPSASSCARPVQTREVPGRTAAQEVAEARTSGALARRAERADMAAAAAPAAAGAAVAPAAPTLRRDTTPKATESRAAPTTPAPQAAVAASPAVSPAPPATSSTVTAGVVNDNADFADYLAFRARTQVPHRPRDVRERYLLEVKDAQGHGVADAEVAVSADRGNRMWARTDTAGRVWLHPDAFDGARAPVYDVTVRKDGRQAGGFLQRGRKSALEIRLDAAAAPARARLDLVFLIDATGSMADEIGKLKASLRSIAADVAGLPSQPDLCLGLVAYRDKGDAFLLRSHDFTNDLNASQTVLDQLHAAGGGDYPEAMNEALHETIHGLRWRGNGTTRMVLLLADAPPHLDYGGPQYDDDMVAALGKGIKIFSVGASGLDKQGEYIQRQMAQYTGGRFVFLTYADASRPASGPGRETVHDVGNYSVESLDRLIVRLVREELAPLQRAGTGEAVGYNLGLRQ